VDQVRLDTGGPSTGAGSRGPGTAGVVLATICAALACGPPGERPRFVEEVIPTNAQFRDVFFVDPDHGFLIGGGYGIEGGLVGRTTDGGQTWSFHSGLTETSRPSGALDLRAGWFFDPRTGLVVGDGVILRTADAGEHWRRVHRGPARVGNLCDVTFVDDTHGWAVGHGGLLATHDGGETWFVPSAEPGGDGGGARGPAEVGAGDLTALALHFFDRSEGVAVGGSGRVYATGDAGVTWWSADVPASVGDDRLESVLFVGESLGWIVGEGGLILKTVDGGASWRSVASGTRAHLTDVHFVDERRGWAVGYLRSNGTSVVLESGDGGETWLPHLTVSGEELHAVTFTDPDHGWAVGERVRREPQKLLVYR